MRIHIADLKHEIAKAQRERETLIGKLNEVENAIETSQGTRWLLRERLNAIAAELEEIEDYLEIIEDPELLEPCSSVAVAAGCTCEMSPMHPLDIDPPEPVRSRRCPLHGSEPDEDDRR